MKLMDGNDGKWVSTEVAANVLNVSRRTIYYWIDKGYLQCKQGYFGKMVFIENNKFINGKNK